MLNRIQLFSFLFFSLFSSLSFSAIKDYNDLEKSVVLHFPKIEAWEAQRFGLYYTQINTSDYNHYTIEVLKNLGLQNDLKALEVLGNRYLFSEKYSQALTVYRQAAILGSTYALQNIGKILERSEKNIHAKRMITYSYLQAALYRGDRNMIFFAALYQAFLPYISEESYYPLTTNEKKIIHQKGADIYLKLVEARRFKGLPAFDNSPFPEFMNDYYRYINWESMHIVKGKVPLLLETFSKK
jgi:hypothetical protein